MSERSPLHALVLTLSALDAGTLPAALGELPHAAFFALLDAADPALAAHTHDVQARAAFTLSPLYGFPVGRGNRKAGGEASGPLAIQPGHQGWLRLTVLDAGLFAALTRHLLASAQPVLQLGRIPFAITEVLGSPGSHPWAGYSSLERLAALEPAGERWTLDFASPTAIHWGAAGNGARRIELFPQPRMALAGLRGRWDKLTGERWGRAFEEWVETNVVVSRVWRWRTEEFTYRRQRYAGGVGRLEYRLLDQAGSPAHAHLNRLLHFAFYTGIGYKTTHGLGQVRLEP
jgi:CRISPR-associated endoribonuclease Cas6